MSRPEWRSGASVRLEACVDKALDYVRASGVGSYDYYDWWATRWGQRAKQWAYRTEPWGNLVFGGPILALEWWAPFLRPTLRIPKRVYPITVAQHGLALLERYSASGDQDDVDGATRDADDLVGLAAPSEYGLCWGFPYDWSTNQGVIPANQPAATQTAYGFDLLDGLWQVTGEQRFLDRLMSVATAMDREYPDIARNVGVASTYHGRGQGDVAMNPISYRAHMLARAAAVGAGDFAAKAHALVDYLLDQQEADGSWFYGEAPKNRFIDHFHTCFMIKNLYRANRSLQRVDISNALDKAVRYYWEELFDSEGLPRPFAVTVRPNLVRYESYDFAECLALFALLGPSRGFTWERLEPILSYYLDRFVLPDGSVRFRLYRLPVARGYPYYRWGLTAGMLALAQLANSPLAKMEQASAGTP